MKHILIGYLFIFFNLNLNIDGSLIQLIPDFIGYIFIVQGLNALAFESNKFSKAKPFAISMSIYWGIIYVANLLGLATSGILYLIINNIFVLVSLFISYTIIMGIKDIEARREIILYSSDLKTLWNFLVFITILNLINYLLPSTILAIFIIMLGLVIYTAFLLVLNSAKNIYNALPKPTDEII